MNSNNENLKSRIQVLVVYREPRFSFNAVDADRAILRDSALQLQNLFSESSDQASKQKLECELIFLEAEELLSAKETDIRVWVEKTQLVLTMAQSEEVLKVLRGFERAGVRVLNSTASIVSCYRHHMHNRLKRMRVAGYPKSVLLPLKAEGLESLDELKLFPSASGYWVKRGDFHALQAEDVTYASDIPTVKQVLREFSQRGIGSAIIQQNIVGDVYKVYGVPGLFFHLRWVCSSKGVASGALGSRREISEEKIAESVMAAARLMELEVFGADCVIDEQGDVHLIDMNDWPSFRVCREDAAKAIARHCLSVLEERLPEFSEALHLSSPLSSVLFQKSSLGKKVDSVRASS